MHPLSIVFAGTPAFALPCLEALATSFHRLVAIYTQPDRPSGRGRRLQPSAVKTWGLKHHLPIYQPTHFKNPEELTTLASLNPDVMVVMAYGLILPPSVLTIPRLGCINVHASLLPHWRGASPIQQSLLCGDKETGISIMQMDKGMDTGDVLLQKELLIAPKETAASLHDKLAHLAVNPLLTVLDQLSVGIITAQPQQHEKATYAPKINKNDARIIWHNPAEVIERQIRAFNPWPIAHTYADNTLIRIHEAAVLAQSTTAPPGCILAMSPEGIQVATGENIVIIKRLQFAGGKNISVLDWLNAGSCHLHIDQVLE